MLWREKQSAERGTARMPAVCSADRFDWPPHRSVHYCPHCVQPVQPPLRYATMCRRTGGGDKRTELERRGVSGRPARTEVHNIRLAMWVARCPVVTTALRIPRTAAHVVSQNCRTAACTPVCCALLPAPQPVNVVLITWYTGSEDPC